MSVPTFVDLQGFIVDEIFVVKEVAILREGYVLFHYIFGSPVLWDLLIKSKRSCVFWLIANHHGLHWVDEMVPYNKMAKRLINGHD